MAWYGYPLIALFVLVFAYLLVRAVGIGWYRSRLEFFRSMMRESRKEGESNGKK